MHDCPLCEREFTPAGLHGHLRFSHDLRGEDLEAAYEEATGNRPGAARKEPQQPDQRPSGQSKEQPDQQPQDPQESVEEPNEDGNQLGREARPVPGSVKRARSRESRGGPPEHISDPVERALDEYREARERRRAVEHAMDTKRSGLFGDEQPANETWTELLEDCREAEEQARNDLHRLVRHREVDRS